MDEAFLELLEKKDFSFITVKEICEKAGVNRSTFYLHYESVADLLSESAQYVIRQFTDCMPYDPATFIGSLQERPPEELYLITPEYLVPYLQYIREHRRIFRTTVEHSSALRMEDAYLALHRHVFSPILGRFHVSPDDHRYLMAFFINGLVAIIEEWLKEDCRTPVEHIISLMQTCVPPPPQ